MNFYFYLKLLIHSEIEKAKEKKILITIVEILKNRTRNALNSNN